MFKAYLVTILIVNQHWYALLPKKRMLHVNNVTVWGTILPPKKPIERYSRIFENPIKFKGSFVKCSKTSLGFDEFKFGFLLDDKLMKNG